MKGRAERGKSCLVPLQKGHEESQDIHGREMLCSALKRSNWGGCQYSREIRKVLLLPKDRSARGAVGSLVRSRCSSRVKQLGSNSQEQRGLEVGKEDNGHTALPKPHPTQNKVAFWGMANFKAPLSHPRVNLHRLIWLAGNMFAYQGIIVVFQNRPAMSDVEFGRMSFKEPELESKRVPAQPHWYERYLQPCIGELVGSAFFIYIGCVSVIENSEGTGRLQPALAHGLALGLTIAILGNIR
ncbi:hypothetical protein Chor_015043 [Crotalus horridus]